MNKKVSIALDVLCLLLLIYIAFTVKLSLAGKAIIAAGLLVMCYSIYMKYTNIGKDSKK